MRKGSAFPISYNFALGAAAPHHARRSLTSNKQSAHRKAGGFPHIRRQSRLRRTHVRIKEQLNGKAEPCRTSGGRAASLAICLLHIGRHSRSSYVELTLLIACVRGAGFACFACF